MRKALGSIVLALLPAVVLAAQTDNRQPTTDNAARSAAEQHFILTPDHVLTSGDIADLASRGVTVQRVLPGLRYVVRADSIDDVRGAGNLERFAASKKIASSALRVAAQGKAFTRVRLMFHDDVSFDDAQAAIERAGGTVERPLQSDFELPHVVMARIPTTSIDALAHDDRVFGIYGPPHRIKIENDVAANVSHVTPLFSAPYGLTGQGVALSLFDIGQVDASHPEFGSRVTIKISPLQSLGAHPTHVTGTMIAQGINPQAKGMAPAATVFDFDANANNGDTATMLSAKQTLPSLGVMADNNSWGYELGWQINEESGPTWVWWGDDELLSAYDALDTSPYDAMAKTTATLFVHSAGNDASNGLAGNLPAPWSQHAHVDDQGNVIKETFCYSQNGTGTDCPVPTCTTGRTHCETTKHPNYGPFFTLGLISAAKNVIAVGAITAGGNIAGFSSRGPARDGRVKPDIVAVGVNQLSTVPNGGYDTMSGTSMSSPVVTGMSALLVEQWRKTFGGANPSPQELKTLLIAGADDIGNPGPDYTYGFGLADAQKSADLIIADGGIGARIHTDDIAQGQQFTTTLNVASTQNVRVVLAWRDPEIVPGPNDTSEKTLVNDLDLKIFDPSGATVLPYVLDVNSPSSNATRGENHIDNVEEVEIPNAAPGTYRILVNGTQIPVGPTQRYTIIANAQLGTGVAPCTTPTTAAQLASGVAALGHFCNASDVNTFMFTASAAGTVRVTATDSPVKVTVVQTAATATVAPNSTATLPTIAGANTIQVQPAGTLGTSATYVITATYPFASAPRNRSVRH